MSAWRYVRSLLLLVQALYMYCGLCRETNKNRNSQVVNPNCGPVTQVERNLITLVRLATMKNGVNKCSYIKSFQQSEEALK